MQSKTPRTSSTILTWTRHGALLDTPTMHAIRQRKLNAGPASPLRNKWKFPTSDWTSNPPTLCYARQDAMPVSERCWSRH